MDGTSALRAPLAASRLHWRVSPLRLAACLTILAVAVRLIHLGTRPMWLDEAYSAWFSSRGWHELWTVVPTYEPHPPFYYSLLKLWRDLFGGASASLRAFSLLFGTLTVPVIIAAALEMERQQPSGRPILRTGMAGFLAAMAPMLVLLDQEARPYPLLIFAYSIGVLGLLRLFREFRSGAPGDWASWSLLAIGTELALWAHGLGVLYALCVALALAPAWLARPLDRRRLVSGIACAVVVALLYLPCLLMMMNRAGDWGTGWLRWEPVMLLQLLGLYAVPVEVLTVASALAALVLLLLIKRCIQHGFSTPGWTAGRALLLLWWGPPVVAVTISALFMPVFLPRTLAPTLVPAYLAIAGALARIPSERERFAFTAALVITLLPTSVQVAIRPPTEQWDEVAAYLERHVAPGDRVWFYPNDSALPLRQAGLPGVATRGVPGDYPAVGIKGPIRAGSPAVVSLTHEQAIAVATNPAVAQVPTIWLVTRQQELFDPDQDLPKALAKVRRVGSAEDWGYIEVRPYYAR